MDLKVPSTNLVNSYEVPTRRVNTRITRPRHPENMDKRCVYHKALYNTLVKFGPRVCLEIGTHTGGTTAVFQRYFDDSRPDGLLITCDIKKFVDLKHMKNVHQLIVAHHTSNIRKFHRVNDEELLTGSVDSIDDPVKRNVDLIKRALEVHGEELVDFSFVDGDHQTQAFVNDMAISEAVLRDPKLIMIDDSKEEIHECSLHYDKVIRNDPSYQTYDYEDWDQFVGCSLVVKR